MRLSAKTSCLEKMRALNNIFHIEPTNDKPKPIS